MRRAPCLLAALALLAPAAALAQGVNSPGAAPASAEDVTAPPAAAAAPRAAELPFFEPAPQERPPVLKPPEASHAPNLFFGMHGFVSGNVSGTTPEIGLRVASAQVQLEGLWLPDQGLFGLGMATGFGAGWSLSKEQSTTGWNTYVLAPQYLLRAYSDFSEDAWIATGATFLGVRAATCAGPGGTPFFVDLRGPTVLAWLPMMVAGDSIGDNRADVLLSVGAAAHAGFIFF